jgi:hypothetical protein
VHANLLEKFRNFNVTMHPVPTDWADASVDTMINNQVIATSNQIDTDPHTRKSIFIPHTPLLDG